MTMLPNGSALLRVAPLVCLLGTLAPTTAHGTTSRGLSLSELVDGSDLVVRGVVREIEPGRDGGGRIQRRVTFEVEQYLIGEGPTTVLVKLLGGELEGAATLVHGEAELTVGGREVLFLELLRGGGAPVYGVTGMAQGRFAVARIDDTGVELVSREIGRFALPPLVEDGVDPAIGTAESCYCTTYARFAALVRRAAGIDRVTAAE